jgi:hypothetical protein
MNLSGAGGVNATPGDLNRDMSRLWLDQIKSLVGQSKRHTSGRFA